MRRAARWSVLLLAALAACSTEDGAAPGVADAWIRAAPPGAPMHAGYMTVSNPSRQPLRIVGVTSPDFERIELHRTVVTDGVARMREEATVEVPPGEQLVFEPGGRHLMLFGARRPLALDETVQLTLRLHAGAPLAVTAVVRAGANADADDHRHH